MIFSLSPSAWALLHFDFKSSLHPAIGAVIGIGLRSQLDPEVATTLGVGSAQVLPFIRGEESHKLMII